MLSLSLDYFTAGNEILTFAPEVRFISKVIGLCPLFISVCVVCRIDADISKGH